MAKYFMPPNGEVFEAVQIHIKNNWMEVAPDAPIWFLLIEFKKSGDKLKFTVDGEDFDVRDGDYVIKDSDGLDCCSARIFEANYKEVTDDGEVH